MPCCIVHGGPRAGRPGLAVADADAFPAEALARQVAAQRDAEGTDRIVEAVSTEAA